MECKLCGREKPVRKSFSMPRTQICNSCYNVLGYDAGFVKREIEEKVENSINGQLARIVQQELPKAVMKVLTENNQEIDVNIKVI